MFAIVFFDVVDPPSSGKRRTNHAYNVQYFVDLYHRCDFISFECWQLAIEVSKARVSGLTMEFSLRPRYHAGFVRFSAV